MEETPDTILRRFAITGIKDDAKQAVSVMSMPVADLVNPFTGAPTVGPLAILLDAAGGKSNHFRRTSAEWTVTSELSLEISPDGADVVLSHPGQPVVANCRPLGPKGATALSVCTFSVGDIVIGGGTVRSFYLPSGREVVGTAPVNVPEPRQPLTELMSVGLVEPNVLAQREDAILNNSLGIINGGVASTGLELVAAAAVAAELPLGQSMHTASLRVNFLRPFFAGESSRYVGTPMRVGRRTAVGDAEAIGNDGKVALTARITTYS